MKVGHGLLASGALLAAWSAGVSAAKPIVLGVATTGCVRSTKTGLQTGQPITLMDMTGKTRYAATLGEPTERCGGQDSAEPGYALKAQGEFDLALALIGKVSTKWKVRSCASSENVHLFLYSGSVDKVQAHEVWYLGYDVEPDCKKSDQKHMRLRS